MLLEQTHARDWKYVLKLAIDWYSHHLKTPHSKVKGVEFSLNWFSY